MMKRKIKEVLKEDIIRTNHILIYIVLIILLISSCSSNWHYYVKTGKISEQWVYDSYFHRHKGLEVAEIKKNEMKKNSHYLQTEIDILESPKISFLYDTTGKTQEGIIIQNRLYYLDSLWGNFLITLQDSEVKSHIYWRISSVYKLNTPKRKYLLLDFLNSLYSLAEFHYPIIIDYTSVNQILLYKCPEILNMDISVWGDFNLDSVLEYSILNDSTKRIEYYSLSNSQIIKNDTVFLELKDAKIPLQYHSIYKIKNVQRNSSWWCKEKLFFSFQPR